VPTELKLKKSARELEVHYADGSSYRLSAEYLRVHSPSAEVTGHGAGEGMLVTGKQSVGIAAIEPVGRYAVRLVFDDGHDTGLYSWDYLYQLATEQEARWQDYLQRLRAAHASRDPQVQVLKFDPS
jgi:DUF971 family protein